MVEDELIIAPAPITTPLRPNREQLDREFRQFVTPALLHASPIYNWFVYPHSFSRELVDFLLERFGIGEGGSVLDVCVGAGTTVLACKQRNVRAWGYDILPLSVMITRTKTNAYRRQTLTRLWQQVRGNQSLPSPESDIPIVRRAFAGPVKDRLTGIVSELDNARLDPAQRDFFQLALLSVLEDVSCTKKSGGWLSISPEEADAHSPEEVTERFRARVEEMLGQLSEQAPMTQSKRAWGAEVRDARLHKHSASVDAIITSPPYLNRHDYTRVFALELALGLIDTQAKLKYLRYTSLRSHPEAKEPAGYRVRGYTTPEPLRNVLAELPLEERGCDERVHKMVKGYFEDMYLILRAAAKQVRQGGHIAFVLGDVRFGGVLIPVSDIVGEIGEQAGLTCTDILVARQRGNSAQQMRDHGKVKSPESIIVWQNPETPRLL